MDSVVYFPFSVRFFCVLSITGDDFGEYTSGEHFGVDSVVKILEWILWWLVHFPFQCNVFLFSLFLERTLGMIPL